jgi:hypothetical protein
MNDNDDAVREIIRQQRAVQSNLDAADAGLKALPEQHPCPDCKGEGSMKGRGHHGAMRDCTSCGGSGVVPVTPLVADDRQRLRTGRRETR